MPKGENRGGGGRTTQILSLDAVFEPEPVTPEEARRREIPAAVPAPRDIVELTSPIGHRLRVPPPAAEKTPVPPGTPSKPKK